MAEENDNSKHKVSRNAKLPQHGFSAIRVHVSALAELAAPSTKERIAEQLGVAAKGRFLGKLAAAGYYGLFSRDGEKYQVTERGHAFLSDNAEESLRAMREGLMSTNYGSIIHLLRSQEPKESVIAARLQDDLNVPDASAPALAKVLIAVAKESGLIAEHGRFSASAIEDATETLGSLPEPPAKPATPSRSATANPSTPAPGPNGKPAESRSTRATTTKQNDGKGQSNGGAQGAPLGVAPVQVIVNVDASKLGAQEIADLVRALRAPGPPST